jgi:hypothetical protein
MCCSETLKRPFGGELETAFWDSDPRAMRCLRGFALEDLAGLRFGFLDSDLN